VRSVASKLRGSTHRLGRLRSSTLSLDPGSSAVGFPWQFTSGFPDSPDRYLEMPDARLRATIGVKTADVFSQAPAFTSFPLGVVVRARGRFWCVRRLCSVLQAGAFQTLGEGGNCGEFLIPVV